MAHAASAPRTTAAAAHLGPAHADPAARAPAPTERRERPAGPAAAPCGRPMFAGGGLLLQRQCACGDAAGLSGRCEECGRQQSLGLQRKIDIGAAGDIWESEADRAADAVVLGTGPARPPSIRRIVAGTSSAPAVSAPASVGAALAGAGRSLDPPLRGDMERRFGNDFSRVRIHTDAAAARSAHEVNAHAYTVGRDVVFGAGRCAPSTHGGRRLIAHELAHVVQQGSAGRSGTLQRQGGSGLLDDLGLGGLVDEGQAGLADLAQQAEEEVRRQLRALGGLPGTGALFSKASCPKNFCNPFRDVTEAKVNLALTAPVLLAGVAKAVNPRVVPLWASYLAGGSAPKDLTSSFGADFTASQTTLRTTGFILAQTKKEIAANQARILGPARAATVDLTPRMTKTLAAIDNPTGANAMDFNVIGEIPGNIAGGIGKDQLANPIGAQPSPFDDSRTARIAATLTRTPRGIKVKPSIEFEVKDTIDLCPGNCGAVTEQDATIPMSRFEATGLSGDVPFVVRFPAPAAALGEFTVASVAKPSPPKKPAAKPATSPAATKPGAQGAFNETAPAAEGVVAAAPFGSEVGNEVGSEVGSAVDSGDTPALASGESGMDDEPDASA